MTKKICLGVMGLGILLLSTTLGPPAALGQQPLAQLAEIVLPGDPQFVELTVAFDDALGVKDQALANAFLAGNKKAPVDLGGGFVFFPLANIPSLNTNFTAGLPAAQLGVLQLPAGSTLLGRPLPTQLGVATTGNGLILALVDLNSGQPQAFVGYPTSLSNAGFFSFFSYLQLILKLLGTPVPGPSPALACPRLENTFPVDVDLSGGPTILVSAEQGNAVVYEISVGTDQDNDPAVFIDVFSGSAQFSLIGGGNVNFGFLFGNGVVRKLPVEDPFRLLISGSGKTSCLQGSVSTGLVLSSLTLRGSVWKN